MAHPSKTLYRLGAFVLIYLTLSLASAAHAASLPLPILTPQSLLVPNDDLIIYHDALSAGWDDWSWSSTRDFAATPGQGGSARAIKATLTNWGGLSLHHTAFSLSPYTHLEFYIRGDTQGGQALRVWLQDDSGTEIGSVTLANASYLEGGAVTTTYRKASIPLSALNGYARSVARINWQGSSQPDVAAFLIDAVRLVAAPAQPLTATVNAGQVLGPVNPRLYGTNAAWWDGNIHQTPNDVLKIKASGVTVMRFPGGSSSNEYHWQAHEPLLGGGPDWELGFSEFMNLANQTGAEAMITVNFGTGSAAEAADWVRWANVTKGYGIKLWEVGNEVYGNWETSWTHDGAKYCNGDATHDGFNAFVTAMKAVDPTIQVGAVGVDTANDPNNPDPAWGPHVLSACGAKMDFYVVHRYALAPGNRDYAGLLADPPNAWPGVKSRLDAMMQAAGRVVPVAVTEYNSYFTEPEALAVQTVNTLFLADTLGQIMAQGFPMANHWDILNGTTTNGGDYGYLLGDGGHTRQPSYFVFPVWRQAGDQRIALTTNADAATTLSLYATRHSTTGDITLIGINKTGSDKPVALTLQGIRPAGDGSAWRVQGAALDSTSVTYNGQANPPLDLATVAPLAVSGVSSNFSYTFPSYSVTALTLTACFLADINCDRRVAADDVQTCAAAWLRSPGQPGYDARCLIDGDADIDVLDIMAVAKEWGWQR